MDVFPSLEKFRYNEDDLISVIQSVIFENVGLMNVDVETKFSDDLKMDEPTKIEILLAIEHAIGFKIDNVALSEINSIKDAVALYKELYQEVEKDKRKNPSLAPFQSKISA